MKRMLWLVLMLCAFAASAGELTLMLENDVIFKQDRDYTHGTRMQWLGEPNLAQRQQGWSFGQNLYTPHDLSLTNRVEGDHQYGAWLYAGAVREEAIGNIARYTELDLGVVGPWALGEETQTWIHEHIGNRTPKGWDNQCENEPTVELLRRYALIYPFGHYMAVEPHAGVALGNVQDYGNVGADVMIGWNVPRSAVPIVITPTAVGNRYALYAFAGTDTRAVAHNVFLDGNLFRDNGTVTKRPVVCDLYEGVAARAGRAELRFTWMYRTREYWGQAVPEQFGSVAITTVW